MRSATAGVGILLALVLTGCTPSAPPPPSSTPVPTPTETPRGPVQPSGTPEAVATGLGLPWSLARFPGGTFVSQRDDARVLLVDDDGGVVEAGVVPDVLHGGEGGLLGLAVLEGDAEIWLYAFHTAADDNRIVRMAWDGTTLGAPEVLLTGIARAGNHNGGRLEFGPDGMLYATTGDAAVPDLSQDPASLNGKILRMTPEGDVPDDNPFPESLVYSLGHRNPQGLAWDDAGQLWAAEFGQNTWDEFNRIDAGANYGWPIVEGQGGVEGYVDPVLQWSTSEASPSGLAYVDGTFFLAALRGERLWAITVDSTGAASATPWFVGEYGRIRDVGEGPDGSLWFLTSNTGSNGSPREGDDRLLQVALEPVA